MQLDDLCKMHNIIKSEAYKEFAERLKEKQTQYFYETNRDITIPLVSFDRIDNLLKETYTSSVAEATPSPPNKGEG